jgi:lipopolysaccharide exporter
MTPANAPKKVLVGGSWIIAARAIDRLVGIVSISILARLLKPVDFGVVAVAGTVVTGVEVLSAFGFDWALVRHREPSVDDLNAAWTLRVLLGLVTFLVLALLGPPAAAFYRQPALTAVLVAMGAASFAASLQNIGTVYFRRDFVFHKEFLIRSASKIAGICVSLPVAFHYRSYWALVAGIFAVRAVTVGMSYLMHPFRPRLSLKNARDLFGFSSWLLFGNVIEYCRQRFGDIYIGRVYGASINGLFAVSQEISSVPISEVSAPIGMAAYSKYAEDVRAGRPLAPSYVGIVSLVWMISLPMAAGTAAVAPAAIRLLLGPNWQGADAVVRWMAIGTAFSVMSAGTHYVYWALGRTQIPATISAAGAVAVIPITMLCSHFAGYAGVAFAYACVSAVMVPVIFTLLRRVAGIRFAQLWPQVWRVVLGTSVMSAVLGLVFAGSKIDSSASALRLLVEQAVLGAVIYTAVVYVAWRLCARPPGPEHTLEQGALRALSRWTRRYAD